MKVLLVEPYMDCVREMNAGLAYIAAVINVRHTVQLYDPNVIGKKERIAVLRQMVTAFDPECVGFSVHSFNFSSALALAEEIKRMKPGIFIVFGGSRPSLFPEETIGFPCIDALCIGESEKTFLALLDSLQEKRMPDAQGVWVKKNGGAVIKGKKKTVPYLLDDLPFPQWDYFDVRKYLKMALYFDSMPLTASRGCPYSCVFCYEHYFKLQGINDFGYRVRNASHVVEEINVMLGKYRKYGVSHFSFTDPTFGYDKAQLFGLCDLLMKEGLQKKITWMCETRADLITDEWARAVSRAGCILVELGIESGSDAMRNKVYHKNISDDMVRKATEILKKRDILVYFYLMAGGRGEDRNTLRQTEAMLAELSPFDYGFAPFSANAPRVYGTHVYKKSLFNIPSLIAYRKPEVPRGLKGYFIYYLLRMRLKRWIGMFRLGLRLRKARFLIDSISYLCSKRKRGLPLSLGLTYKHLIKYTVCRYLKEARDKRRKAEPAAVP